MEDAAEDYFNPETGELMLGDIVISVDKVTEQAEKYGHSERRELAFLVAHSMLHLCGYDHMEDEERLVMEDKQEEILETEGVQRDEKRISVWAGLMLSALVLVPGVARMAEDGGRDSGTSAPRSRDLRWSDHGSGDGTRGE